MSSGILPLSNKTLDLLKQKHPEPKESSPETLLQCPFRPIHPVAYNDINESLVMRASILTKGGSGPSGLDADGRQRILTSAPFGNSSRDLADVDMDAVLLIDAENALSSINRKVMLHNLKFVFPIIATYIINCYAPPSR